MRQRENKSKDSWPEWLDQARQVLKPPERMTVSEWSDKYRILDEKTSAIPGKFETKKTPYLRGIMDAFNDPSIEEIIFVKPTQVGGTESMNNMMASCIAQDPSSALVVYPTLDLAEFTSKNRIQPMIELCPELKKRYYLRDSKDLELQFEGMYLVLAGANSAASLASRPIRYLFLDEVDKYPPYCGDEGEPISLAKERTKTYSYNKKIVMTSTPTTKKGNIWSAMENADEVRQYYVHCPHCGQEQLLKWKQLKFDKTLKDKMQVSNTARYECSHCKEEIQDHQKMSMLRNGHWKSDKPKPNAKCVAFWMNTLYSPWVRFGDVAYEFMKSKDYPEKLKNFINSWLAEPWNDTTAKMNRDVVLERQAEHEEGEVPKGTLLLTAGVDVQKDYFYYTIRAWSTSLTSWNVAHGTADTWDQIEIIMNSKFYDGFNNEYQVNLCAIDSGHRTDEVYNFCAYNQQWAVAVKGSSAPILAKYRHSLIDKVDSKAYGLKLYIVDTDQYKDMIAGRLARPNGPGSWMVYKGCDSEYAEQVCSEEKVTIKKGNKEIETWQPKGSHADNHYLDCEVYAFLAADLLQVRYMSQYEEKEIKEQKKSPLSNDGWLNKGEGWIR